MTVKMDYMFVNKTGASANLAHSSDIEHREIQQHVQKRLQQSRRPKPRCAKPVSLKANESLSLDRHLSGIWDPFKSASVCLNNTLSGLLEYHIKVFLQPTIWIREPQLIHQASPSSDDAAVGVLQDAIQDSLVMYAALAAVASRVRNVDFGTSPLISEVEEIHFANNAMRLLRGRIPKSTGRTKTEVETLVCAITLLLASEVYREKDDYLGGRAHCQAAANLLSSIGGISQMANDNLRHQILMADLFLSMISVKPCLYGTDYDPGPPGLAVMGVDLSPPNDPGLGTALLRQNETVLPRRLRKLVVDATECYHVLFNRAPRVSSRQAEIASWATNRSMSIVNRLLALDTPSDRVNAVRIAVICWVVLWTNNILRSKAPKNIAVRLQQILNQLSASDWLSKEDVQFWILCTGYSCAQLGSDVAIWFQEHVRLLYRTKSRVLWPYIHLSGLCEAMEEFLASFLFHGPIQHSSIRKLAQSLH